MLEKQEIVPSEEKSYDMMLLNRSLTSAYGKNVKFHCLRDKEVFLYSFRIAFNLIVSFCFLTFIIHNLQKKWLFGDVRLCLTKNFELINCKTKLWKWKSLKKSLLIYQPCPTGNIFYPPFNNTHSVKNISAEYIILTLVSVLYCLDLQISIF